MSKIKDPAAKANKKKFPLHPFEFVWYILTGLVGAWGLTYIVLGLIAQNLPVKAEDEGLVEVNGEFAKTFKLDFFGWGLIILAIAGVAAVVVLLLFSNKVDRDYEKNVRRAQRMAQMEAEEERLEKEEAIDAEVEPVQEQPKVEEPEETNEPEQEPKEEEAPAEEAAPEEEKNEE